MEFGIFNSLYLPRRLSAADPVNAEHNRLADEVTWTRAADRAGFKYTWATEHHFLEEYSHLSANESFLAYLAGVTERIHIGTGIFNITPPVNHPARVAERVGDARPSQRRALRVRHGSRLVDHRADGLRHRGPELTKEMFDEVVPQFPRMWRGDRLQLRRQILLDAAAQRAAEALHAAAPADVGGRRQPRHVREGSPNGPRRAVLHRRATPDTLAPLIEIYKKKIENAEPVGEYVNNNVMVTSQMLCLEDGGRGPRDRHRHDHPATRTASSSATSTPSRSPGPARVARPHPRADRRGPRAPDRRRHWSCIGTPDECAKAVKSYADVGADQLTFGMLSTTMPIEVAVEAVETFGKHVIPEFDTDPVHRTTRQREAQLGRPTS